MTDLISDRLGMPALADPNSVGLEIEVEGEELPRSRLPIPWKFVADGSLRGEDSGEYIYQTPRKPSQVFGDVVALKELLEEDEVGLDTASQRTSVHVHVNYRDCTMQQMFTSCAIYYMLEEELFDTFIAPHRKGSFYCLRLSEASTPLNALRSCLQNNDMRALRDQGALKYSALNLTAIQKFGTLEYRALQGTVEPHTIQAWVNILLTIKELAKEIGTINNLAELFDQEQLRSRLPIRFTTTPTPPSWYEAGALSLSILSLLEEEPVECVGVMLNGCNPSRLILNTHF